jgi:hypothetical protein
VLKINELRGRFFRLLFKPEKLSLETALRTPSQSVNNQPFPSGSPRLPEGIGGLLRGLPFFWE